jgi:hypothetical protein
MNPVYRVRTIWLGSIAALAAASAVSPALFAQSQDNSQSVAEAARKAKEQKKAAAKDAHVITDDTIRLRPASADSGATPPAGTIETSTPPANPTAITDSPAPSDATASARVPAADPKKKEEQSAEVAKAKEVLVQAQAQLDVLKRELALDSDSFYTNPDYSRDARGKAKLDELQRTIGDKQISVEDLKRQLAALMQEAGISPDAVKTPAPQLN